MIASPVYRAAKVTVLKLLSGKTLGRRERLSCEPLESRRLLAVLPVLGTAFDDFCTIDMDVNFIYASMNGVMVPQPIGLYDGIEVHLGDGDDILEIRNTLDDIGVRVFLFDGADQVKIAPVSGDLDSIGPHISIPAGSDSLQDGVFIYDDEDAGNDTYNITEQFGEGRLSKGSGDPKVIWEADHISVGVFLNNDNNTVNIDSSVTINGDTQRLTITGTEPGGGSGGNDVVNFNGSLTGDNLLRFEGGPGDNTMNINGDVFAADFPLIEMVGGISGIDTLAITDPANTDLYDFNSSGDEITSFEDGVATGHYIYLDLEAISLTSTSTTQGADYEVNGLHFNTDLTINAGAGDDNLIVGDDLIQSADFGTDVDITFNGQSGTDTVLIRDSLTTSARTHTWGANTYDHSTFNLLTLSSVSTATLNSGSGSDIININFDPGPGTLIVNANLGNDTFNVVPDIITQMQLNGGGPTAAGDTVNINPGSLQGVFTPNGTSAGSYQYPQRDDIIFTGLESFPQPGPAPSAADLAAADDSGISNTDNVTNDTVLTFSGTGAAGGSAVKLFRDGVELIATTATVGGGYSFANVSFPTGDDTFAMTVAYISGPANLRSLLSAPLNVRVDTIVPAAPTAPPDMAAATDTGMSTTDNVTRDNTPQFDGTVVANDLVRLFANGVQVGVDVSTASGTYSIVTSTLADGSQIMTAKFEDLAGNLSSSSSGLVVTIDTVAPASPTTAPDLTAASDTGLSSSDNITRDNTPTFTGSAPGNHIVRLLSSGVEVGFVQVPLVGTTYTVTSSTLGDGHRSMTARFEDIAGNISAAASPALTVLIDTVAPTLNGSVFNFLTSQNLQFTFSEDLGGGIRVTNFSLKDVTNNLNIPNASLDMSYVPNIATVTFLGFTNGILSDADWQMKVNGDVTDIAGNHFVGTEFDFFFLNGDANRDRRVNLADFNILAANFGQSNRNFSQGNFNYDNIVNLQDFNILAGGFGAALSPAEPASIRSGSTPIFDESQDLLASLLS